MSKNLADLKAEMKTILDGARAIAAKAEAAGRDFTPEERAYVDDCLTKAKGLQARIGEADLIAQVKAIGEPGGVPWKADSPGGSTSRGRLGGKAAVWKAAIDQAGGPDGGLKAVTNGTVVNAALDTNIVTDPRKARFVQDLVEKDTLTGTTLFAYLRQNVRDNQAAFVARGAKKPTSRYESERIQGELGVIAHITDPQHRYDLLDQKFLGEFLQDELVYGLDLAIEAHVIEVLLADAGVTTIPWATDLLTTIRKAKTKLAKDHVNPTALIIAPDDVERLDLSQDLEGRYYFAGPAESDASPAWSVPVISSTGITPGVGLMGDMYEACRLYVDGRVLVDATESGKREQTPEDEEDLFTTNMLRIRAETRAKAAVRRPFAAVEVDLTA